jgi:hypothetical protein
MPCWFFSDRYVEWQTLQAELERMVKDSFRFELEGLLGEHGMPRVLEIVHEIFNRVHKRPPSDHDLIKIEQERQKVVINKRNHRGYLTWPDVFSIDAELGRRAWKLGKLYGYSYPDFDPANFTVNPAATRPSCSNEIRRRRSDNDPATKKRGALVKAQP